MRAPDFWYESATGSLRAAMLSPLGALYDLGGRIRFSLTRPYRAPVPVICVGNVTAGGTGKTPFSIMLAHGLKVLGHRPHIITRGYGGRLKGPVLVDPHRHAAAETGDEPLLLADAAPVWVAKDRRAGAMRAAAAGADIIVMDDGLQNPSLGKTISLVLVDGALGFGNGRVIPAGPLREHAKRCFARADALIIMGKESERTRAQTQSWSGPVFHAHLEADASALSPVPYIAFAGIARPEKFFATLEGLGARLTDRVPFADHHMFSNAEIEALIARARAADARLITTAKDAVRLSQKHRAEIDVLPVVASVASREAFGRFLIERLASEPGLPDKNAHQLLRP